VGRKMHDAFAPLLSLATASGGELSQAIRLN
jgi:hypothetical protein